MSTSPVVLGDVEVSRVVESEGSFAPTPVIFPDGSPRRWERHRSWLEPDFWDPRADMYRAATNIWVLRSAGRTVLVDTGIGNHKYRPYSPTMSYLDTDLLTRLAAAGVRPDEVDLVVNTHLHADHVGWNTRLVDGVWVPTFPRATYLINAADVAYWDPTNDHYRPRASVGGIDAARTNQNMFEDSVAPVLRAGQAVLWEESHTVDENLRLDLRAGHTPGSGVLTLASRGEHAVFVGDLLHSPLQILDPDLHTCLDEDVRDATAARRRVLSWAADHRALVLPAHFPARSACEVTRDGPDYRITSWADFSEPAAGPDHGVSGTVR
jgi:glyoxylase-like metal-dependent hydrolase (beta-lactamase superfamily II)